MSIQAFRRVFSAGVAALICLVGPASSMAYAEEFTFWSLWEVSGDQWEPAQTGAAEIELEDESVIAAKYVRSEVTLDAANAPSQSTSFKELCPDTSPAPSGSINVAVVIDYGSPDLVAGEQSPPATSVSCETITQEASEATGPKESASGATALSQAATVETRSDGFITALNGYPTSSEAAAGTDETQGSEESDLSVIWLLLLILIVVLIIMAVVVLIRRNRSNQ